MSNAARITFHGEAMIPHVSGALYWPEASTLIASDLHFEKGSAFAAKGQMLPPYDTRATLKALSAAIDQFTPDRVIALGDSFHDGEAGERISNEDMRAIQTLAGAREWIWITGNHDEVLPDGIGGQVAEEFVYGALAFRHEPLEGDIAGEICGHFHPCVRLRAKGRRLRRRCFVTDGARLIMPAFGAFTGGLEISDEAYDGLFDGDLSVFAMGRDKVYAIEAKALARAG